MTHYTHVTEKNTWLRRTRVLSAPCMLPNPLRHPHARVFPSSSEVASERLDLCLEGCSSQTLGKRHNDNNSLSAIALWCGSLIHLCFTCHQRRRHIKPSEAGTHKNLTTIKKSIPSTKNMSTEELQGAGPVARSTTKVKAEDQLADCLTKAIPSSSIDAEAPALGLEFSSRHLGLSRNADRVAGHMRGRSYGSGSEQERVKHS